MNAKRFAYITILLLLLFTIAGVCTAQGKTKEIWTPVCTWSNVNEITGLHVLFDINTEPINIVQSPWGISWICTQFNPNRQMYFYVDVKSADNPNQIESACFAGGASSGANRVYLKGRCYLNIGSVYSIWTVTIYKITYQAI